MLYYLSGVSCKTVLKLCNNVLWALLSSCLYFGIAVICEINKNRENYSLRNIIEMKCLWFQNFDSVIRERCKWFDKRQMPEARRLYNMVTPISKPAYQLLTVLLRFNLIVFLCICPSLLNQNDSIMFVTGNTKKLFVSSVPPGPSNLLVWLQKCK